MLIKGPEPSSANQRGGSILFSVLKAGGAVPPALGGRGAGRSAAGAWRGRPGARGRGGPGSGPAIGWGGGSAAGAANGSAASMGLELLDGGVKAPRGRSQGEAAGPAAIFLQWSEMANWAFPLFHKGGSAM